MASDFDLYFVIIYMPTATALEVKGHQAEKAVFTHGGSLAAVLRLYVCRLVAAFLVFKFKASIDTRWPEAATSASIIIRIMSRLPKLV